jgi:hypothetical protein
MTPAEARKRIMTLTSEVATNPDKAAELAPEIGELGRTIQATPGTNVPPITPKGGMQVCVAHDKKICKGHKVCMAHPKKTAIE